MNSYLNSLSFKNYKSFSSADIEIKPLTFFIGANSSGKSSILQLILAIEQTINNKDTYTSALKLNGHYVNLGEDINIIKDKKKTNTLSVEFELNKEAFRHQLEMCFHAEFGNYIELLNPLTKKKTTDKSSFKNIEKYLSERKNSHFSFFSYSTFDEMMDIDQWHRLNFRTLDYDVQKDSDFKNEINNIVGLYYEYLSLLKKSSNIKLCYDFLIRPGTKRLSIKRYTIKINEFQETGYDIIYPDVYLFNTISELELPQKDKIEDEISFNGLRLQPNRKIKTLNIRFVNSLLESAYQNLKQYFKSNKISYVGPLRADPQRYYFLDESNSSYYFDAQSGQRLAEILKRNKDLGEKINEWLKDFEINISVNEFKDIIHKIKVSQNGLKLDITDVGFGYSQILPILVQGFMSENNSMTIIEQPEIHLHPKMQAALADLFIDIISSPTKKTKASSQTQKKTLLIETHSEYMLKRLRRRIAEGKISNNDVAIYFIESRNKTNSGSAIVKKVNVSSLGDIEWPEDFYITAYDDDIEFLKRKIKKNNE